MAPAHPHATGIAMYLALFFKHLESWGWILTPPKLWLICLERSPRSLSIYENHSYGALKICELHGRGRRAVFARVNNCGPINDYDVALQPALQEWALLYYGCCFSWKLSFLFLIIFLNLFFLLHSLLHSKKILIFFLIFIKIKTKLLYKNQR